MTSAQLSQAFFWHWYHQAIAPFFPQGNTCSEEREEASSLLGTPPSYSCLSYTFPPLPFFISILYSILLLFWIFLFPVPHPHYHRVGVSHVDCKKWAGEERGRLLQSRCLRVMKEKGKGEHQACVGWLDGLAGGLRWNAYTSFSIPPVPARLSLGSHHKGRSMFPIFLFFFAQHFIFPRLRFSRVYKLAGVWLVFLGGFAFLRWSVSVFFKPLSSHPVPFCLESNILCSINAIFLSSSILVLVFTFKLKLTRAAYFFLSFSLTLMGIIKYVNKVSFKENKTKQWKYLI